MHCGALPCRPWAQMVRLAQHRSHFGSRYPLGLMRSAQAFLSLAAKRRLLGRGESGWCLDWTSVPGVWRHTVVRFHLRGDGMQSTSCKLPTLLHLIGNAFAWRFVLAVLFLVLQFYASSWMPPRDFVCEGNVVLIVGLCRLSDFRLNVLRLRASRPLSTGSCKSTWTWRLFACLVVLVYFEHSPTRWTSDGSADSFNC